jgi:hypothetical protein
MVGQLDTRRRTQQFGLDVTGSSSSSTDSSVIVLSALHDFRVDIVAA